MGAVTHEALAQYLLQPRNQLTNQSNDPNVGSSRNDSDSTTEQASQQLGVNTKSTAFALLSTFAPTIVISSIWLFLFLCLRRSQKRFYSPRSYLGNLHEKFERTVQLPTGWFNWIPVYWRLTDTYVLQHVSLDGYLFLRFLKLVSTICLVGALMLWPVLLPIHATGGGHAKELDALNFGNVTNPRSFYAHVVMSALFFAFVFYMVIRESIFYASLRQAYLLSPLAANRLSSRTVLFMSVPKSYLSKHKLEEVFGQDIVQRIWIVPRSSKLNRLAGKRDRLAFRLEYFETKLVKEANMARIRYMQKNARHLQSQPSDLEAIQVDQDNFVLDPTSSPWAPEVRRPRTYVRGKGLVDAIGHYRACLEGLIPRIARLQRRCQLNKTKCVSAAFIEFKTQGDAQLAYQSLAHYQPFAMSPRYIGIPPQQILWHSLKQSWLQRVIRKFVIQGAIATLIIFWSIPSAFIGTISNIDYLAETVPFLHFVENLPGVIKTIISGVLPAAALALLMSAVPAILQFLSRQTGVPSVAKAELFMQNANFCFQLVQVFLVTTLTSAASAAVGSIIKDPLSLKDLLASNLPKASNFYVSYFLIQGMCMSTLALVQLFTYAAYVIMRTLFDRSLRRWYFRRSQLSAMSWGNTFPIYTNMAVIAITYSAIAPLILGFASFGLFLIHQAYKYNLLFVLDHQRVDTKGLLYPRALQQLLVGVYLAEICLIGLFAIRSAFPPMVLMILLTVVTALAHIAFNEALEPLLAAIPRVLNREEDGEENLAEREIEEDSSDGDLPILGGTGKRDKAKDDEDKRSARISERQLPASDGGISSPSQLESPESPQSPTQTNQQLSGHQSKRSSEAIQSLRKKLVDFLRWYFIPGIYANPFTLRRNMAEGHDCTDEISHYPDEIARNAYFPPSVSSPVPLLWIPRDAGGWSVKEVQETTRNGVIRMTDDGAHLNEQNEIVWDKHGMRPPIWTEKVFY